MSVQGFSDKGYKICFYSSRDCIAKDNNDFVSVSGPGSFDDDLECVSLGNGSGMFSYEVVEGDECTGAPGYLAKPDPSHNEKHCYNGGLKSAYGAIVLAAESFCRDVVNDSHGPVWSNYERNGTKQLSSGYYFKLAFSVYDKCAWTVDYDDCMRYMRVPIDSCDCSAKTNKQGGWVENNCIMARIDPNDGDP